MRDKYIKEMKEIYEEIIEYIITHDRNADASIILNRCSGALWMLKYEKIFIESLKEDLLKLKGASK